MLQRPSNPASKSPATAAMVCTTSTCCWSGLGCTCCEAMQSMYEDADLVVPFFSKYDDKPWCSMEWETIRGILLERRKDDAVVPVHLDDTHVSGWSAVNFGIRLRGRTAEQIADVILQPLQLRTGVATPPPAKSLNPAPKTPPQAAPAALAIWKEKLDYLQQQEAITDDPGQKFAIGKQIEECKQKIAELSPNP